MRGFLSLVLIMFIISGCSKADQTNPLCDRVISSVSSEDKLKRIWAKILEAHQDIAAYDTTYGLGDSIEITSNPDSLINKDLKFINIDWYDLGFYTKSNYVYSYPFLETDNEIGTEEKELIRNQSFRWVDIGNHSLKIRFKPIKNGFSSEVICNRANSSEQKKKHIMALKLSK